MEKFMLVLKSLLPIIVQVIGYFLQQYAASQGLKARAGEYSFAEQLWPVYGQAALGYGLMVGGLGWLVVQVISHNSNKALISLRSLTSSATPAVDPSLSALNATYARMVEDPGTAEKDLALASDLIIKWRAMVKGGAKQ